MSGAPGPAAASSAATTDSQPRGPLKYVLSHEEYEAIYKRLLSRIPALKARAPLPTRRSTDAASALEADEFHADSIRLALRIFAAGFSGLKLYEKVMARLAARSGAPATKEKIPLLKSPALRLSAALSLVLFLHRTLHRFLHRLRWTLLSASSKPFRQRNPRTSLVLTSKLTPAFGAATLASWALAIAPANQMRLTIAIYMSSRAVEFWYNSLSPTGIIKRNQPSWAGSWLLMPFACGQLLHAFVFDRDCFPTSYGNFIMSRSPEYVQPRPDGYPKELPWPSTSEVADGLAKISQLGWPSFASPILFPNAAPGKTLPPGLQKIAPITDPADPAISRLACALLHPHDPSCSKTLLQYVLRALPAMARFFAILYGALSLLRFSALKAAPGKFLASLAMRIGQSSLFLTGAIGTAWASICAMQRVLPGRMLRTERWFIGGFIAGLWGAVERPGNFGASARVSIDSVWKVGKKRGWWRGAPGADVACFAAGLALVGVVYERKPEAVDSAALRKALGVLRGEGWVDRAAVAEKNASARKGDGVEGAVDESTKLE